MNRRTLLKVGITVNNTECIIWHCSPCRPTVSSLSSQWTAWPGSSLWRTRSSMSATVWPCSASRPSSASSCWCISSRSVYLLINSGYCLALDCNITYSEICCTRQYSYWQVLQTTQNTQDWRLKWPNPSIPPPTQFIRWLTLYDHDWYQLYHWYNFNRLTVVTEDMLFGKVTISFHPEKNYKILDFYLNMSNIYSILFIFLDYQVIWCEYVWPNVR